MNKLKIEEYQKKITDIRSISNIKETIEEIESNNFNEKELKEILKVLINDTRLCKAFISNFKKQPQNEIMQKYYELIFSMLLNKIKESETINRYNVDCAMNLFIEDKEKVIQLLEYYEKINFINNNQAIRNIQGIIDLNLENLLPTKYINEVFDNLSICNSSFKGIERLYREELKITISLVIYVLDKEIKEFYCHPELIKIFKENKKVIKNKVVKKIDQIEEMLHILNELENF